MTGDDETIDPFTGEALLHGHGRTDGDALSDLLDALDSAPLSSEIAGGEATIGGMVAAVSASAAARTPSSRRRLTTRVGALAVAGSVLFTGVAAAAISGVDLPLVDDILSGDSEPAPGRKVPAGSPGEIEPTAVDPDVDDGQAPPACVTPTAGPAEGAACGPHDRAERPGNGHGPPDVAGHGHGPPTDRGKGNGPPDDPGKGNGNGPPDDPGKGNGNGPPDDPGGEQGHGSFGELQRGGGDGPVEDPWARAGGGRIDRSSGHPDHRGGGAAPADVRGGAATSPGAGRN